MILAPVLPARIGAMRALLATMTSGPGIADPDNALIPFRRFDNLHTARLVVLDDLTVDDPKAFYGVTRPDPPIYLAFLGDFDGSYNDFLDDLVLQADRGLRQIFSLCEGYSPSGDLRAWLADHEAPPSAYYVNYVGRTVRQTREEEALRIALRDYLLATPRVADAPAVEVHQALRRFVKQEKTGGRLTLTPADPTPFGWTVRHVFDWFLLFFAAIAGLITLPLTFIPLLIFALIFHARETTAPQWAPRPDRQLAASLSVQEDYDITNQFSAIGFWKPGLLRALVAPAVLFIINLTACTIYTRGRLTRIHTIHFARWVYLDNRTRLVFASVYDGSLESYNEDFINKVSVGLNVIFGNGIGYPRTNWLVGKGAKDEQPFKYFLRRHEVPTDVFYNAHAGFTAYDLLRNSTIRNGLEKDALTEKEAREWVELL